MFQANCAWPMESGFRNQNTIFASSCRRSKSTAPEGCAIEIIRCSAAKLAGVQEIIRENWLVCWTALTKLETGSREASQARPSSFRPLISARPEELITQV